MSNPRQDKEGPFHEVRCPRIQQRHLLQAARSMDASEEKDNLQILSKERVEH